MKKSFFLFMLFSTASILTTPKTKNEKNAYQRAHYLKRKQLINPTLPKIRNQYFNNPILAPYYQALILTPEYTALQQARAQSHAQCLYSFKTKHSQYNIDQNRSAYNKIYYSMCKDASKALRNTTEYKLYQSLKLKYKTNNIYTDGVPIDGVPIDDVRIDESSAQPLDLPLDLPSLDLNQIKEISAEALAKANSLGRVEKIK